MDSIEEALVGVKVLQKGTMSREVVIPNVSRAGRCNQTRATDCQQPFHHWRTFMLVFLGLMTIAPTVSAIDGALCNDGDDYVYVRVFVGIDTSPMTWDMIIPTLYYLTIDSTIFFGLTALTSLSLYMDNFVSLPDMLFQSTTSLTELNLDRMWVINPPTANTFYGLSKLTNLGLNYMEIKGGGALDRNMFMYLTGYVATTLDLRSTNWPCAPLPPPNLTSSFYRTGSLEYCLPSPSNPPPSQSPTPYPSPLPTLAPSTQPTLAPSPQPTPAPSPQPTPAPSPQPTPTPTLAPSQLPTPAPSPSLSNPPSTAVITTLATVRTTTPTPRVTSSASSSPTTSANTSPTPTNLLLTINPIVSPINPSASILLQGTIQGVFDPAEFSSVWRCPSLQLIDDNLETTSAKNSLSLKIKAGVLHPGQMYTFTLTVVIAETSLQRNLNITTAMAPTGGSLTIYPTAGSPLSTLFTVATSSWSGPTACFVFTYTTSITEIVPELPITGGACVVSATVLTLLPQGDPSAKFTVQIIVRAISIESGAISSPTVSFVTCQIAKPLNAVQVIDALRAEAALRANSIDLIIAGAVTLNSIVDVAGEKMKARDQLVYMYSALNGNSSAAVADRHAQALQMITHATMELSTNSTRHVLALTVTLLRAATNASWASSLSTVGMRDIARTISSLIERNSSALVLVTQLGRLQLLLMVPCQKSNEIRTNQFTSTTWTVDRLSSINGECGDHDAPVRLPPSFPALMNNTAQIGIHSIVWPDRPTPSNAMSPINTVNALIRSGSTSSPLRVANLTEPLQIRIRSSGDSSGEKIPTCASRPEPIIVCNSYNTEMDIWSSDGCQLTGVINSTYTCSCTHLTDFALMLNSQRGTCNADVQLATLRPFLIAFMIGFTSQFLLSLNLIRCVSINTPQARRAIYFTSGLNTVLAGIRAVSIGIALFLPSVASTVTAQLITALVPVIIQFYLLTFFAVMLVSIGRSIQGLADTHHQAFFKGFARSYGIGNALLVIIVPSLVIASFVVPSTDRHQLPTMLLNAASIIVAGVCFTCSVAFDLAARSMFTLIKATSRDDSNKVYIKVSLHIIRSCTHLTIVLIFETIFWVMSILALQLYMHYYAILESAFLTCNMFVIFLVHQYNSHTIKVTSIVSRRARALRAKATRKRIGEQLQRDSPPVIVAATSNAVDICTYDPPAQVLRGKAGARIGRPAAGAESPKSLSEVTEDALAGAWVSGPKFIGLTNQLESVNAIPMMLSFAPHVVSSDPQSSEVLSFGGRSGLPDDAKQDARSTIISRIRRRATNHEGWRASPFVDNVDALGQVLEHVMQLLAVSNQTIEGMAAAGKLDGAIDAHITASIARLSALSK